MVLSRNLSLLRLDKNMIKNIVKLVCVIDWRGLRGEWNGVYMCHRHFVEGVVLLRLRT